MRSTRKRLRKAAIALTLAIAAGGTPSAFADPPPLQGAESATQNAPTKSLAHVPSNGDDEWAYIAVGAGVAGLALLGVGGTFAASRRSTRGDARRSTIA